MNRSHLVAVEGVFVEDQFGFLLVPLYAGGDLAAWLEANKPGLRPLERCKQLARDLLHGLLNLHSAGVVHCDIKSSPPTCS
jgi:serine/threonine protein kinase